jgi:uncharacterized membrane-anchored protein YitT (DUF2179 family)
MSYTKTKKLLKVKEFLIDMIYLTLGCATMAIGTAVFLLPNQLSTGGFTGIATIFYYLFHFSMGTVILALNIPFFILAFFKIGKKLVIKSIIGTSLLSLFIDLFEKIPTLTNDILLACIYGGIFIGFGLALVLKANASTGGTDLITYIARAYKPYMKTSSIIVVVDVIIIGLNVIFFKKVEIGLYSAISIYLMGKMIDIVFEGINFTKMVYIISQKYEEISKEIDKQLQRGSTGIYAKGMYTNTDKMMLMCVGARNEVARMKQIATQIDSKAFIIISNARETWGKGFKGN